MDCKFFGEQIVFQNYDELEAGDQKTLAKHLQTCRDCQQLQTSLHETQQFFNQCEEIDRPIDLAALHEIIQPKSRGGRLSWRPQLPFWRGEWWGV